MSYNTSDLSHRMSNRAEGSPEEWEQQEPANPLRTSTMPAVVDTSNIRAGETGVLTVVTHAAEGEDNSEAQDSSLTRDEVTLVTNTATDPQERSDMDNKPVLIVEDTVELGEVIQATLEGMGLDAQHATHGAHGLELLKTLDPKLILMDIGLPDISGWKMLDYIKEHYAAAGTKIPPIVVITAYGDPANRLIGKLQNIHSYLIKPFTPDQVENIVSVAINGGSLTDDGESPTV